MNARLACLDGSIKPGRLLRALLKNKCSLCPCAAFNNPEALKVSTVAVFALFCNMQLLKRISLAVLIVLLLAFLKLYVDRSGTVYRDFVRNLIANVQLLVLTGVVVISLLQFLSLKLFRRPLHGWKAALFFLLLLGLAEAGTDYLLRHPRQLPAGLLPVFSLYYGNYGRQQIEFDPHCARYDTGLTYTLLPDTGFDFNNYEFKTRYATNGLGLRDDTNSLRQPAIICLGDSYTMGWGVDQSATFSSLLQQRTGRQVLNAGISSYGTARELLSLERMDLSAVQYLIIQYCGNDVTENNTFIAHHYRLPVMPQHQYDSLCQALQNRLQYYPFRHILTITRMWAQQAIRKPAAAISINVSDNADQSFQQQAANFLAIIDHQLAHLPHLKIMVFDATGVYPTEQRFIQALRHLLQEKKALPIASRISLIDISPYMKKEDFFLLDGHFNARGHATVARILSDAIKTLN